MLYWLRVGSVESVVSWLAACAIQSVVCFSNNVSYEFYCHHFLIVAVQECAEPSVLCAYLHEIAYFCSCITLV